MAVNILKYILILILFLAFHCSAQLDLVQTDSDKEYKVKSAFIFNFIKFAEWTPDGKADSDYITLSVIGDNPFGDNLEILKTKDVKDKSIRVRYYLFQQLENKDTLLEFQQSNVLFICESEQSRYETILQYFENKSVLTIGDEKDFAATVGVISFDLEKGKICFDINFDNAKVYGVKLNARLYKLAREVYKK